MKNFFKALSALTMALCLTATALIPTGTASARTNVIAQLLQCKRCSVLDLHASRYL